MNFSHVIPSASHIILAVILNIFTCYALIAGEADASHQGRYQLYLAATKDAPKEPAILSVFEQKWADLDGLLLTEKVNRIVTPGLDGTLEEEPATAFDSSYAEFHFLFQPIANFESLAERRAIIDELMADFEAIDTLLREFGQHEDTLLAVASSQLNDRGSPYEQLAFSLAASFGMGMNVVYTAGHLRRDWQSRGNLARGQQTWLLSMGVFKALLASVAAYEIGTALWASTAAVWQDFLEKDAYVLRFASCMRNIRKIIDRVKASPKLANTFPVFLDIDDLETTDPRFAKTLEAAEYRLASEHSWMREVSMRHSSSTFDDIIKLESQMKILLWGLARLDSYAAVVRIHRNWEARGLPVSFVEFDHTPKRPVFKLEELWNPMIDDAVPNDFNLNAHGVFNGPGTCGKTAAIKSIAAAYLLGQSILIVPARHATSPPVNVIGTYFKVGDDIAQGHSTFQSQRLALESLEAAARHNEQGRTLLLIDEPYSGLPYKIGQAQVAKFFQTLLPIENLTMLVSTHYESIADMEAEYPEDISTLQPELLEDETTGVFTRTYRILPGKAEWWFNDTDRRASRFIEQISKEEH